jgi:hypothetical protein
VSFRAFTKAKQDEYLENIRAGMQRGAAADVVGLDRIKVREFILTDKAFERLVLNAEVDATEHVREALYQSAVSGNVSAAKIWLDLNAQEAPATSRRPEAPKGPQSSDPFEDLDNVAPLDPRRRAKR